MYNQESFTNERKIEKLKELESRDNFLNDVWESKGLVISSKEICMRLNNDYRSLIKEAIYLTEKNYGINFIEKKLCIKLRSINKNQYDREEKELLLDKVEELSNILNIDLRFELNRWLYGYILAKIFTKN